MAKRRAGPEERARLKSLVGRWRRSGRSAADFGERHGVSQWALYYWAKRFSNEPKHRRAGRARSRAMRQRGAPRRAAPGSRDVDLIPVELLGEERPADSLRSAAGMVEIQLRSGDVLRVGGEVPVERLREIVAVVRQSC